MTEIYKMSNAGGMSSLTRYVDMLAGNPFFQPSAFESIATITIGAGGAASAVFNSIPTTYKQLQVRWVARSAGAESTQGGNLAVYAAPHANNSYYHRLFGDGTTVYGENSGGASYAAQAGFVTKSTNSAGTFGAGILDILDYTNTSKNKTYKMLNGWDDNGSGIAATFSGMNYDTSIITSLTFALQSGSNIAQYSTFALYGIKG